MNKNPYTSPNSRAIYSEDNNTEIVSILDWIITMIVISIPGVNIIAIILWAIFAKKKSKQNFFIAFLLLIMITVLLVVGLPVIIALITEVMN